MARPVSPASMLVAAATILGSIAGCRDTPRSSAPPEPDVSAPVMKPARIGQIRNELKHGSSFEVSVDQEHVTLQDPGGARETLAWSDLRRVVVVTTDEGPLLTDVFIFLETDSARLVIPQDVRGGSAFAAMLLQIRNFDHRSFIMAMSSAEDAEFLCWTGTNPEFIPETRPAP